MYLLRTISKIKIRHNGRVLRLKKLFLTNISNLAFCPLGLLKVLIFSQNMPVNLTKSSYFLNFSYKIRKNYENFT